MKAFNLRLDTLILRFYLMMLVIIIAGFAGMWALSFLALPIFMTCLMGVDLTYCRVKKSTASRGQKISSLLRHLRPPMHHTA